MSTATTIKSITSRSSSRHRLLPTVTLSDHLPQTDIDSNIRFLDLPNEIVSYIISFLDSSSPFTSRSNEQPHSKATQSEHAPIKRLSLVSHRLRSLSLAHLFKHAQLDPYRLTPFLEFVRSNHLAVHISTLVAQLQGPCSHLHPAWWARLLNEVPATSLSIIAAPHVFAELGGTSMSGSDSWAFNMPYQIMRLEQTPEAARQHISYNHLPNILVARPWKSLHINEGSSLKAYTTYEYFLRRTPSLMACLHHSRSLDAEKMFAQLRHFSFVAIFPFYNHTEEILKCIRKMTALKSLFIKLCPDPQSTVLNDEIEEAQGHMDVNDPWNEFATSMSLVGHTCMFLTHQGVLEELVMDDVQMLGIREDLEDTMTELLATHWSYIGDGLWRKIRVTKELSPAE